MRKILLLAALTLFFAGVAFGQSQPAPKNDIYAHVQFDYDASGMRFDMNAPAGAPANLGNYAYAGNFTFDRMLRLGYISMPADNLKTQVEFDFRNFELRLANFDWTVMPGLDISGGRVFKVFSPIDPYIFNNRFQAVGVQYVSGPLTFAAQLGNETDIATAFSGQGFNPSLTATGTALGVVTDPGIKLDPAIIFKPLTGKDLNATIGVNAEITLNTFNFTSSLPSAFSSKDGTSLSAYALVNASGFQVQLEGTYQDILQDPTKNNAYQKLTFYGLVGYQMGAIFPNFYVIADGLNWNSSTPQTPGVAAAVPNITLNLEIPVTVTTGLKIDPMFTYAVSGYNWWDTATSPTSSTLMPLKDWMVALRFDWSFDSRF